MSGSFERPIDPKVYPNLRLERKLKRWSISWDADTGDRYFVKAYSQEKEHKARREELGLVLCAAYGAITPGHVLIYDKKLPVLVQRLVPYTSTINEYYKSNIDSNMFLPDEQKRARLLASLSKKQVTELFICCITDHLIYNWDAHGDNFLMDSPGGSLVGIDKGLTGHWIGHPHLCLESPSVEGNLVHYVKGVSKPANNITGHVYEPVFTNVYRGVYKPDLDKISTVLDTVEKLDDTYDSYIRAILDGSGLEAFVKRRENLRRSVGKLFSILGLETR